MAIALHVFLLQLLLFFFPVFAQSENSRNVYLVQMKVGDHKYGSSSGHSELLEEVLDEDSTVPNSIIYSYKESFTGFSASLTQNEVQKLKERGEVLQVLANRDLELHTTRSWDLMNLPLEAERNLTGESELVVAVLDSGIWLSDELFHNDSSDPPSSWQHKCHNITCNNKIVGARLYYPEKHENYTVIEEKSVSDTLGHGTHTASIVAGSVIKGASYFDLAKGTMRGGVPSAKIAVYKTCWKVKYIKTGKEGAVCPQDKVLQAIEDAIKDNVSIISYSQGFNNPIPLEEDLVSWSFLRAFEKGILTSTSAGNFGKAKYSVTNGAPWLMTVAASVKDRLFKTELELKGEKEHIAVYNTINPFPTQKSFYPLEEEKISDKRRELVIQKMEEGKDVFFNDSDKMVEYAFKDKAKGVIVILNDTTEEDGFVSPKRQLPLPSIFLNISAATTVTKYYTKKNIEHSVRIHKTEEIPDIYEGKDWESTAADISSRGPNCDKFIANILKPDIAAPGLDILAGWPENINLLPVHVEDSRHLKYNIKSGTSMACPHATALALYVKSFYPLWSPSAIKSALMTTATKMEASGYEFAYGSGHLNATNVLNPGLVYETQYQDYIDYMCKQGYKTETLKSHLNNTKIDCSNTKKDQNIDDLNYPTMAAQVEINTKFTKIFTRTVTNVGSKSSAYIGKITVPEHYGVTITVNPTHLLFNNLGQRKTFTVTVTGKSEPETKQISYMLFNTWLTWTELHGSRTVRSPIVIYSIAKGKAACTEFTNK